MNIKSTEKMAINIAKKFLIKQDTWCIEDIQDLSVWILLSTPTQWKCRISNQLLDDHGEHLEIAYDKTNGEAFVKYFTCEDNMEIFVLNVSEIHEVD